MVPVMTAVCIKREVPSDFLRSLRSQMSRLATGREVSFNGGSFSGTKASRTLLTRDSIRDGSLGRSSRGKGMSLLSGFLKLGTNAWFAMLLLEGPRVCFNLLVLLTCLEM